MKHSTMTWVGIALLGMAVTPVSWAVQISWNTTTTGLWSNGANWVGGNAPTDDTTTDTALLNATGVNGNEIVQFNADRSVGGITFANTGTTALQSDSGTARTLTLGVGGIKVNVGAGAVTLGDATNKLNLKIATSESWTNSSSSLLTVVGGVSTSVAGTQTLTVGGSGSTTISGALANGTGTLALTKIGGGTLTLSGASSGFSGPITLAAGTVQWSSAANLGTGPMNVTGNATLNYTPAVAGPVMTNSSIVVSDGASFRFQSNTGGGAQAAATPASISGGSALNPIRLQFTLSNTPTLRFGSGNTYRGNVSVADTWYTASVTPDLGHASNIFFTNSSFSNGTPTFNNDYVLVGSQPYFSGGVFNRRLFNAATAGAVTAGAATYNHSAQPTLTFPQGQTTGAQTFNILPVGFSVQPNQPTTNNLANLVFGSALQGTAGASVSNGNDGPISITVSNAASDIFVGAGFGYSAGTATNGTITKAGSGNLTLQSNSSLGVGKLTVSGGQLRTLANIATSGTMTISGGATLRLAGASGQLSGGSHSAAITNNGALAYSSGSNQTLSGAISGGGSLSILGDGLATTGTLTLAGNNSFSGATTVSAGTLGLNYATQDFSKLADGAALTLGNAGVVLTGGTHPETVFSTTLTAGATAISQASGSATLNLNGITRNPGATVDFGAASLATTDNTNTNGILGGYATVAGTDWAVNSTNAADGSITALASYTNDTWAAGNNTTVTANGAPAADSTTHSLRFHAAGASALTLAGTNTIASGGILVTSAVGANSSTVTGGTLQGASGTDLVVIQNNTNAAGALTIASQIADNSSATALTKTGAGTLVLSGTNTYTGGTFLNAGTISFASGGLGTTGTVRFAGPSTLQWAAGNTQDISGRLAINDGVTATLDTNGNAVTLASGFGGGGAGGLIKAGTGTLTLAGANSFTGSTTISAGTLTLGNASALAGSTLTAPSTGGLSFGSLTAATLGGLTGSNSLTISNASGAGVALAVGANNTPSTTYAGSLGGLGSLTKTGYGQLVLSAPNRYLGATTISNGRLALSGGANRLPNATALSFANQMGALLNLNSQTQVLGSLSGGGTAGGHVWVNGGSLFVGSSSDSSYAGSFIDSGTLIKQGNGTFTLSGESTFGGTLRIDAGSVKMAGDNRLGYAYGLVIADNGTLDLNGYSAMVGSLRGSGTVAMSGGTGALDVRSTARTTYSGLLTGYGALIKENTGWLTLTNAANAYSGGTQLAGGVVEFAAGALGTTGPITVTTDQAIGGASVLRWLAGNTQDISGRLAIVPGMTATLDTNGNNVTFATGIGAGGNSSLNKRGLGTLSLEGANTYTGASTATAGTLNLNFAAATAPATDILANTSALGFSGGTLLLTAKTSGTTSQTLGAVTVNAGNGQMLLNPNGGSGTTLNVGTVTATAAGGALLVGTQAGAGAGTATITTASAKDANGMYGGHVAFTSDGGATVDWATTASVASPYALSAYSGYTNDVTTPGVNSRITASASLGGGLTTNSLKIENPAASQSLSLGANLLTLTSGGLLVTGSNAFTIAGTTGATRLNAGNGSGAYDLVVHQYNNGGLDISAVIGDGAAATSLTKAGTGPLTLSGANTFTGGVRLTAGTLNINSATALGTVAGTFTIYPGTTIDNTSGAGGSTLTLTNNYPQTWNGDFTYLGTGGRSLNFGTGSTTTVTLGNDTNLNVAAGRLTVTANFSGGVLTKSGAGELYLAPTDGSRSSSLSGLSGLTINGGNVYIYGSGLASGGFDLNLANVAGARLTLEYNAATVGSIAGGGSSGGNISIASDFTISGSPSTTFGGLLGGGGTGFYFTKNGLGTLTLTNASNSFNNIVRVNNGTLAFAAPGALGTGTTAIELNNASGANSGRLAYTGSANATLSRGITVSNGLGTVANLGSGTLTLSGTQTNNGTILRLAGGTIDVTGKITGASVNSDLYIDGGTVILSSSTNDYAGVTLVSAGTLQVGKGGTAGSLGPGSVIDNAALVFNRSDTVTVGNAISGTGALAQSGTGTLGLTGNNSYTGGTNLNAGTLALGSAGAIGSSGLISFGGGTLQSSAANTTDYSSRFSNAAAQAYKLDTNGQNVALASPLTSIGGSLTKSGAGTLTVTNTHTYTAATNVNGGTLLVNGALSNTSAVTVAAGATLGGAGSIAGDVTSIAGHVSPGASIGTLTVGSMGFSGVGSLDIEFGTGDNNSDLLVATGALSLGGSTTLQVSAIPGTVLPLTGSSYTIAQFASLTGTFSDVQGPTRYQYFVTYGSNSITLQVVPEPASALLLALAGLAALRRRRQRICTGW